MGYYTEFSVYATLDPEVYGQSKAELDKLEKEAKSLEQPFKDIVLEQLRKRRGSLELTHDFPRKIENFLGECSLFSNKVKWYSYTSDMANFSKKYPEYVFTLEGHGEEPDDIWRAYFHNGKYHKVEAQIVFPEYDPEKLTTP